jgi:hypothetical protein|tara:strand:- start:1502 stop:1918 length:417 start_codon:yes stop_codon:yes gene_type:complete
MTEEKKRIKINADVFWAQLDKINDMSGKYQVNLCNLSEGAAAALEGMGLSIQEDSEKKAELGKYITCKSNKPIRAFDVDGEELHTLIGNKSRCKALVSTYEWTYKNKKGSSPSLMKLVITDLVEFAGGNDLGDDEDAL